MDTSPRPAPTRAFDRSPRRAHAPAWLAAVALGAAGCASRTTGSDCCVVDAASLDVAPGDAADENDARTDAADPDAADIPQVSTCAEIAVTQIVATPGRAGVAYPGSRLR